MTVPLRVIIDSPASGAWNMAVDEAILQSTAFDGLTLRFYQWAEPTLSLGYFQALTDRLQHPASLGCSVVRRASGGGAILHDRELTYSLIAPVSERFGAAAHELYLIAHRSLCVVLADFGVRVSLYEVPSPALPKAAEPFLCFQRRSGGDVVLAGAKICGSAQRRHLSRVLQHGSVLLGSSLAAPELPGLLELTGMAIDLADFRGAWLAQLAQSLHGNIVPAELTAAEVEAVSQISQGKFGNHKWTAKR
ncbi:Octanoyltransferase LipM [Anatilimnocola aggregata]|uniref:Octanoyltransferase LipM n=1 Tax=Anatilimnocola aggregata TaxID=2528021 RepID=A0A517YC79_9BACT|nr:biotin/lipoate A/B protein ligase family protein [Anatilimnocola aggregata]QDU27848.1 Octanoyltransferase LipM [Anatilimnocola aggregata]